MRSPRSPPGGQPQPPPPPPGRPPSPPSPIVSSPATLPDKEMLKLLLPLRYNGKTVIECNRFISQLLIYWAVNTTLSTIELKIQVALSLLMVMLEPGPPRSSPSSRLSRSRSKEQQLPLLTKRPSSRPLKPASATSTMPLQHKSSSPNSVPTRSGGLFWVWGPGTPRQVPQRYPLPRLPQNRARDVHHVGSR
ncbi:hypothetical protein IEO21_09668 [Rhodonia placenta]|uniref:Uncharacterized protein n=1 Tax=Rhodonia placenta TaxID=104341 RepID=A0A8H7NU31_9APHY|nr:hypothetical protein IEO21_09668 [Postia placenta]